jgi:hypothetical protein
MKKTKAPRTPIPKTGERAAMSSKKMAVIASIGVAAIMIIVVVGIILVGVRSEQYDVQLPQHTEYTADSVSAELVDDGLKRVQVDVDTVQSVIKNISRPESYTESVTVTKYWGESSTKYTVEKYVYSGVSRLIVNGGSTVKNVIVGAASAYIWYGTAADTYSYSIADADSNARRTLGDQYGFLMTYEDILSLDPADITDAAYEDYDGESCIFVTAAYGDLGYTAEYYVSVETGLLKFAQVSDDDGAIYTMTQDVCEIDIPSADYFTLPDGTSVIFSE